MAGWVKKVHLSVFGPYIDNMPNKYKRHLEKFRQRNSDIEIKMWNLDDARNLIRDKYPWALRKYDSFKWDIQRSDMSRPAILHSEGGVYMDLDYKTKKPMVEIFKYLDDKHPDGKIFLNQKSKRNRIRLTNSLMFSKEPNHPFWISFLERIVNTKGNGKGLTRHAKIISSCGPAAITNVYHKYIKDHKDCTEIIPLDPAVFNPCSFCSRMDTCGKGDGVLAVHTYDSSWHGPVGVIYKHVYCNGIAYCICVPIAICIIIVIIIIIVRLQKCRASCTPLAG